MNNKIILILLMCLIITGCSGPKSIREQEREIIKENKPLVDKLTIDSSEEDIQAALDFCDEILPDSMEICYIDVATRLPFERARQVCNTSEAFEYNHHKNQADEHRQLADIALAQHPLHDHQCSIAPDDETGSEQSDRCQPVDGRRVIDNECDNRDCGHDRVPKEVDAAREGCGQRELVQLPAAERKDEQAAQWHLRLSGTEEDGHDHGQEPESPEHDHQSHVDGLSAAVHEAYVGDPRKGKR